MKTPRTFIKITLIFVAALLFFGCSKTKQSPKITIIGKWSITADTSLTPGYPPYIRVGINSPFRQFNTDGTGAEKNNTATPDDISNFTYTVSDNVLTCNYTIQPGYSYITTATILKLTAHNLVVEYDVNNPNLTNKELVYMSR